MTPEPKPLILVVDDDPAFRQVVIESFHGEDFNFVTASSVEEAIAAVRSHDKIALIVLDWNLGERSGARVIRAARELYPSITVLVMSGRGINDPRTDAFAEHADAYLDKPCAGTVLVNQIKQLIKRSQFVPQTMHPQQVQDIRPLEEIKNRYIQQAVHLLNHNISMAAEKLGVHRQTVMATLKKSFSTGLDAPSNADQQPLLATPANN